MLYGPQCPCLALISEPLPVPVSCTAWHHSKATEHYTALCGTIPVCRYCTTCHTTPHRTAPHHTMPRHAAPRHTTPHHTTPIVVGDDGGIALALLGRRQGSSLFVAAVAVFPGLVRGDGYRDGICGCAFPRRVVRGVLCLCCAVPVLCLSCPVLSRSLLRAMLCCAVLCCVVLCHAVSYCAVCWPFGSQSVLTRPPMNGELGQLWPEFGPGRACCGPSASVGGSLPSCLRDNSCPRTGVGPNVSFGTRTGRCPGPRAVGPVRSRGRRWLSSTGRAVSYGPPHRYTGLYETREPHDRRLVRRLRDMLLATLRMAGYQPRVTY